jgi:hypothetical protein
MIANNAVGNVLPMMLCVQGKRFTCLQKDVSRDLQAWGAPGPEVKGNAWHKFLLDVMRKNGCVSSTGVLLLSCMHLHANIPYDCCEYLEVYDKHLILVHTTVHSTKDKLTMNRFANQKHGQWCGMHWM